MEVNCSECGNFKISSKAVDHTIKALTDQKRNEFIAYVRSKIKNNNNSEIITITSDDINLFVNSTVL
jgi:hypothetical protein